MRTGKIPFKFDMTALLTRARQLVSDRVGDVTLNLPFVSIAVNPKDTERKVAREVVIRLRDRRVLSSQECCDGCIDSSLESLQEIRRTLVDKQVELSELHDGPLYFMLDMMALGIRQFMTYEERLRRADTAPPHSPLKDFRRPPNLRVAYFDALELLRDHLSHCLEQVAAIAKMKEPHEGYFAQYHGPWKLKAYARKALPAPLSP